MSFPRPDGHHVITPGASVRNADKVIKFVEMVFDGRVVEKYEGPDGAVAHAEVMIGDSVVMFGETMPGDEPMPATLSFYVDGAGTVDTTYRRALSAGADSLGEPANQFYGYRSATVRDAGGNRWTICAVVEKLSEEEINQRMAAMTDDS